MDNERTLRVLADHYPHIADASRVLTLEARMFYFERAANILTSKYIQSALTWDTYQMALSTLRTALDIPAPQPHQDGA